MSGGRGAGGRSSRVLAALSIAVGAAIGASQRPDAVADGELLYRVHCASCHGSDAKGRGPVAAALRRRPPDLTRLAARTGGVFHPEEVAEAIDGRRGIGAHGPSDMPVWGLGLRQSGRVMEEEGDVRAAVEALVLYLETVQAAR